MVNINASVESHGKKRSVHLSFMALGVTLLLHGEAWIIGTVILLGPLWSFLALSLVISVLSNIVLLMLNWNGTLGSIGRFQSWSKSKQGNLNPFVMKLVSVSKIVGIVSSAIIVGAIPTALLINFLGYKRPFDHLLATASSVLFCLTWVAIYSGVLDIIRAFISKP